MRYISGSAIMWSYLQRSVLAIMVLVMLYGCAGVRQSYLALIDNTHPEQVIYLKTGQTEEVLAIGDGFPGWWGYYPSVQSSNADVARVTCRDARSAVPFREPGLLFGGQICEVTGYQQGQTELVFSNHYAPSNSQHNKRVGVIVTTSQTR